MITKEGRMTKNECDGCGKLLAKNGVPQIGSEAPQGTRFQASGGTVVAVRVGTMEWQSLTCPTRECLEKAIDSAKVAALRNEPR
jgi:hypothetical protein